MRNFSTFQLEPERKNHFTSTMEPKKSLTSIDELFYLDADRFFTANASVGLTYDDITLATRYSEILPRLTQVDLQLSPFLRLHIPVVSADMDTVTESAMASAMAILLWVKAPAFNTIPWLEKPCCWMASINSRSLLL